MHLYDVTYLFIYSEIIFVDKVGTECFGLEEDATPSHIMDRRREIN